MSIHSSYPLISQVTQALYSQQLHLRPGDCVRPAPPGERTALYLHIPFCESLCTYCTFHRQVMDRSLAEAYFDALCEDIERTASEGWRFSQVYVGGGTPTVLPKSLLKTIDLCQRRFQSDVVSVETNPNHLQPELLANLRDAGVKRLSVGVQTLDDELLKAMNRYHAYGSSAQIIDRLASSQEVVETFNVDMIFNLPGQSEHSLQNDLKTLKDLAIPQISWYPLMPSIDHQRDRDYTSGGYERKSEFYHYRAICDALSEDYQMSTAWCFNRYAQQWHDEYVTESDHYLGLGSGAFSYVNNTVYAADFSIPGYIESVRAGHSALVASQSFSGRQALGYRMMLQLFALNLDSGPKAGSPNHRLWWAGIQVLKLLGYISRTADHYCVSERGRYLGLVLMKEFYRSVNRFRTQLQDLNRDQVK